MAALYTIKNFKIIVMVFLVNKTITILENGQKLGLCIVMELVIKDIEKILLYLKTLNYILRGIILQ